MKTLTFPVQYENEIITPLKPLPKNEKYDGVLILINKKNEPNDWSGLLKLKHLKLGGINSVFRREDFYEDR